MAQDEDLFEKTFDQQLQEAGNDIATRDISPNRRVPGEIVFEPMGSGVRVTARDEQHRVLWGYVGAKETVRQIHCLVAIYDTLQDLLAEELKKRGLFSAESKKPMVAAADALDRLDATVKLLRNSLTVKTVTDATLERARTIAQIVSDANRQITLEAGTLAGVKSKSEQPQQARRHPA
jgi:hypothetical protein